MPIILAAALVALLVALLNVVMAAALAGAATTQRRFWIVVPAPAGVGLFAVLWFATLLDPPALKAMSPWFGVIAGLAGVLAISGIALSSWLAITRRGRFWSAIGLCSLATVAWGIAHHMRPTIGVWALVPVSIATAMVAIIWGMLVARWNNPALDERRFARRAAMAILITSAVAAMVTSATRVFLGWQVHAFL